MTQVTTKLIGFTERPNVCPHQRYNKQSPSQAVKFPLLGANGPYKTKLSWRVCQAPSSAFGRALRRVHPRRYQSGTADISVIGIRV